MAFTFTACSEDFTNEIDFVIVDALLLAVAVIAGPAIFSTVTVHARVLWGDDHRAANRVFIHFPITVVVDSVADLFRGLANRWTPDGFGTDELSIGLTCALATFTDGIARVINNPIELTVLFWRTPEDISTNDLIVF